jgi:hypothetical protein
MDNVVASSGSTPEPRQAAPKAAILAECDKLRAAGITFVAVHFDGSGDDGATEDVKCYCAEEYSYDDPDPAEYDAARLQGHFEALVPWGFEDGCGGFGDVILDVRTRKITVVRNDRFEDYTTSSIEV